MIWSLLVIHWTFDKSLGEHWQKPFWIFFSYKFCFTTKVWIALKNAIIPIALWHLQHTKVAMYLLEVIASGWASHLPLFLTFNPRKWVTPIFILLSSLSECGFPPFCFSSKNKLRGIACCGQYKVGYWKKSALYAFTKKFPVTTVTEYNKQWPQQLGKTTNVDKYYRFILSSCQVSDVY